MLTDERYWENVYSSILTLDDSIGYIRIPPIIISPVLNNRFIRCFCQSKEALPKWWLGGVLILVLKHQRRGADFEAKTFKIPLDRITLIEIPDYINEYLVKFEPASWFAEMEISVDKYLGEASENVASLSSSSFWLLGV